MSNNIYITNCIQFTKNRKMKIFPTKEIKFRIVDNKEKTLERLKRRTEKSKKLTSQHTNKSFRGIINQNEFKIISSEIGFGVLPVMTGIIEENEGNVMVEIHKVFKVFFGIFLCFPIIAILIALLNNFEEFSPILILVGIIQVLFIRYIFIGLAFNFLSKKSLDRLRDVIDFY